jgi:hypothetical protein
MNCRTLRRQHILLFVVCSLPQFGPAQTNGLCGRLGTGPSEILLESLAPGEIFSQPSLKEAPERKGGLNKCLIHFRSFFHLPIL